MSFAFPVVSQLPGVIVNPLILLAVGIGIVLGSILWLRLHAFLALILGAIVVAGLTSEGHLREAMQAKFHGDVLRQEFTRELKRQATQSRQEGLVVDQRELREQVTKTLRQRDEVWIAASTARAQEYASSHPPIKRLTEALGETCEKIGLLIVMACIIGRCLLASGAAESIVRRMLQWVGESGVPIAFSASTFLLSIPVFFDSVFLLAMPLAKATWLKCRKNYLLFTLALVSGGTITHSLVPPTPGPLFVAEELGVNIGTMMLVGILVGLCCSAVGLAFAYWLNSRIDIPVRDADEAFEQLQAVSQKSLSDLPPLWLALTPVLLPVLLIAGSTVIGSQLALTQKLPVVVELLGDKNIALSLAAVIAIVLARFYVRNSQELAAQLQLAMQEAGLIVLVCCAGGAFGATLQQTGIGPFISGMTQTASLDLALLPLAFLITAIIRSAQGSSTVAMFTAVEIVSSLCPDLTALSYHPVYLAVIIGCGSKPIPWMNDSGFWVISKMSGLTEREMLRTQSPMVSLMGITGMLVTLLAATLFPLVS